MKNGFDAEKIVYLFCLIGLVVSFVSLVWKGFTTSPQLGLFNLGVTICIACILYNNGRS